MHVLENQSVRGRRPESAGRSASHPVKEISDLPHTRTIWEGRQCSDQQVSRNRRRQHFGKLPLSPTRGAPVADEAPPVPQPREGAASPTATLSDVARLAHVSLGTASKA